MFPVPQVYRVVIRPPVPESTRSVQPLPLRPVGSVDGVPLDVHEARVTSGQSHRHHDRLVVPVSVVELVSVRRPPESDEGRIGLG